MTDLTGKVALITGGSKGIGRAIALAYGKRGIAVALTYMSDEDSAQDVVQEIESGGGRAVAIHADVRDEASVETMVTDARDALGQIDILVNNAGVTMPKAWEKITTDDWNTIVSTNLTSAFLTTQQVVPEMVSRGWGRVIILSSVAAQLGGVVGPHYAASKAGLIGLAHGYASVLAKTGVTVNAIAPALIDTGMLAGNPNIKKELIPVGRFGESDEVADVAVLLARNGYMTGQTINVNGGWYMS
ncbi:SDR family NAD(P)-dependent oxidoreductase [Paraburkholderia phenoliruptrix]|uniref:SDR family NAD(P)-dependent oxidoreductase n=1 Tax=Paraburkholderia phenoliruptrix TaxID=252970 RepID=UPI002869EC03|nr:3-oxoacyl-ACP reductase family protein [Paraburkholderia phenoliruptrix]WMY11274.1 3-oxoacyl-ACP reductase FabG [Paraburkholderia phenoliruptrix]